MAGEYDINLSNGNVLTTLQPLEVNGPDNRSTPRKILNVRPSFPITTVTPGTNTFSILGDETSVFRVGQQFEVVDSSGNNGTYTVQSNAFSGTTQITTVENFSNGTLDGSIIAHVFVLAGDITPRFISGFVFDAQNTSQTDGTYTVTAIGSVVQNDITIVPVLHGSIRDNISTPISLPYGEIEYTNAEPNTSLKLPGRGVVNYGEMLVENMVRMTENFAADTSPDTNTSIGNTPSGDPLVGQMWYKTLSGQEGYHFYDGTGWINNFDIDNGSLIFRDPQNTVTANTDIHLTADESQLPGGYGGSVEAGMVVWTENNPNPLDPIFRVLSSGGAERIRIEHDGWNRTSNNLDVVGGGNGSNESYFHGMVGIGDNGLPSITLTLTVEGNGIAVNSDAGRFANTILNAPSGMRSQITFDNQNVRRGEIYTDPTTAGNPLEINSGVTTDVVMVRGGGNVGIDTNAVPTALFQIKENIYFNEGDGTTSTGPDMRFTTDGLIVADGTMFINYDALNGGSSAFQVRSGSNNSGTSTRRMLLDDTIFSIGTTDTINVNTTNNRVGINTVPAFPLDVNGNARFNNPVGINNNPPNGAPVWLEVTGDIQANSQFRGSSQSAANPTYSFSGNLNTGLYDNGGVLSLAVNGVDNITMSNGQTTLASSARFNSRVGINIAPPTGDVWLSVAGDISSTTKILTPNGTNAAPSHTFTTSEASGMYHTGSGVGFASGGVNVLTLTSTSLTTPVEIRGTSFTFTGDTSTNVTTTSSGNMVINAASTLSLNVNGNNALDIESNGTISTDVANYETLVTANNDIPNKLYVDSRDNLKVNLTGGTLTGFLTLHAIPSADFHAATKKYVDDNITNAVTASNEVSELTDTNITGITTGDLLVWDGTDWVNESGTASGFLPLTGGTLSNFLTLHADPTAPLHAATMQYVDNNITSGISGADLNDLSDIDAPLPADGQVLTWDDSSNTWVPTTVSGGGGGGGGGSAHYFKFNGVTGAGITLPAGWSVVRTGIGQYTITHNLGTAELGYAFLPADPAVLGIATYLVANTTNSVSFRYGVGTIDPSTVEGSIIVPASSSNIDDLANVNAASPTDGQVLTWDTSSNEWIASDSTGGGSGSSLYFEIDGATGNGIVLPAGWSSTRDLTGVYTITHNLGTTEIGYAFQQVATVLGTSLATTITNRTINAFTVTWGGSGIDVSFGGQLIVNGAGGNGGTITGTGTEYKVMDNGVVYFKMGLPPIAPSATVVFPLPVAVNQGTILFTTFQFNSNPNATTGLRIVSSSTTTVTIINTLALTTSFVDLDMIMV